MTSIVLVISFDTSSLRYTNILNSLTTKENINLLVLEAQPAICSTPLIPVVKLHRNSENRTEKVKESGLRLGWKLHSVVLYNF